MTQQKCVAACRSDSACTGLSFCDGSGGGHSCRGACHLYTSSSAAKPIGSGWVFDKGQGGDPTKISKLAPGDWWHCYARQTQEQQQAEAGRGHRTLAALTESDTGPIKTNVSSGVIGMEFVEAPAIFKRKGVYYALFGTVPS
jgi:hypothetical protein